MLSRLKFDISSLVTDILDQIPESVWTSSTTTFLDPAMGGGQFVREIESRLRRYRHSDENIAGRVYGIESSKLLAGYVRNKYKLLGTYSHGDFITTDFGDMRFDVVAGNPPFKELAQNGRQTNKSIWKDFLIKGSLLLKDNGVMAMVHPAGWGSPSDNQKITERVFTKLNLIKANVGIELKKYFPGVASTFSYTITINEPYKNSTIITDNTGHHDVDLSVTKLITSDGMSIIKKITEIYPKCHFKLAGKSEQYPGDGYHPKERNSKIIYPNIHQVNSGKDYENGIPVRYSIEPSPIHNNSKIVIPYNGPCLAIIDDGNYGVGWCQFMLIQSDEIDGAKSIFGSKLFKYFSKQKHTQYNETKNLNQFPKLDMKRLWSDQELYDYFGLTAEEIKQIEQVVG